MSLGAQYAAAPYGGRPAGRSKRPRRCCLHKVLYFFKGGDNYVPPSPADPGVAYVPPTAPPMSQARVTMAPVPVATNPVVIQLGPLVRSSESPDQEVMKAIYRYVDVGTSVTATNESSLYKANITFPDARAAEDFVKKWNSRYEEPFLPHTVARRL